MNVRSCIRAISVLYGYKASSAAVSAKNKVLFIDIKNNPFSRYLYIFLKFFHMEGYRIYLPRHPRLVYHLVNDHYASFLIKERIVILGGPPTGKPVIHIKEDMISPDYFSYFKSGSASDGSFLVPMSQHPLMYHAGFWNTPVNAVKRKHSVFMAGNFDPDTYTEIGRDAVFNLMSRVAVYDYLDQKKMLHAITSKKKLDEFLAGDEDNKIILINRLVYDVPMPDLRSVLSGFDFYFALPGVIMPLCHNIVEAMSAGCIPFIQQEYADLFSPALTDGNTAVTFRDAADMVTKIEILFEMSAAEIERMRGNIHSYYNSYLTPASVVAKIDRSGFSRIYLQAEHVSVQLFKTAFPVGG